MDGARSAGDLPRTFQRRANSFAKATEMVANLTWTSGPTQQTAVEQDLTMASSSANMVNTTSATYSQAIQHITENPYRLARDICGIGFRTGVPVAFKRRVVWVISPATGPRTRQIFAPCCACPGRHIGEAYDDRDRDRSGRRTPV